MRGAIKWLDFLVPTASAVRQISACARSWPIAWAVPPLYISEKRPTLSADRSSSFEAGMNGHLAKPYDIPVMLELLADVLK